MLVPPGEDEYPYQYEGDDQDVIRQDVEQVLEQRPGVLICRGGTQFKGIRSVCAVYFEDAGCIDGLDVFAVAAEYVDILCP